MGELRNTSLKIICQDEPRKTSYCWKENKEKKRRKNKKEQKKKKLNKKEGKTKGIRGYQSWSEMKERPHSLTWNIIFIVNSLSLIWFSSFYKPILEDHTNTVTGFRRKNKSKKNQGFWKEN